MKAISQRTEQNIKEMKLVSHFHYYKTQVLNARQGVHKLKGVETPTE